MTVPYPTPPLFYRRRRRRRDVRRERALVPAGGGDAFAGPGALGLRVLQRRGRELALAVLVVVPRGRGVGAAAAVAVAGVVVERGARGRGGAAERRADVLRRGGLVGREVHGDFYFFI